ncbi:MAG: ATP-binding cassette domain-containing protein [Leptolyngbyaceae cyanobacterium RM2_2_4]|nr:ATP-binding cassette domain-containing protein [Leptolyngbyaceae cyanobacterium SM1_4_3]NJN90580.1 ATP-binding cassette domain-containing protein [Leptolyngbyaceae cyanobacterium SL_5_14]NJO48490.1 ATP-binding cassette domain-containing protein [Leptolyngbyaceae cyanobacterium RM2_2_4]
MAVGITQQTVPTSSQQDDAVIVVDQVSKKFCRDLRRSLFYGIQDIAADLSGWRRKSESLRQDEFWALQNVSFRLHRGEALGLVGTNGAGKSTLLRIISGLIKPDTGSVRIRGRLAPLIALGAGFNPILTGRENIYANMSILGVSTQEIKKRFDQVVEFAEIWEAIDAPVQTYSSGMAARLGFACAIYTEPEILLIDEVLAVGDARFKAKCYRRLYELRKKGTSFILVNHNPQAILNTCDSAIYLSQGKLVASSDAETIISQYEEDLFLSGAERYPCKLDLPPKPPEESLGLDVTSLFFRGTQSEILESLRSGQALSFCVVCQARQAFSGITLHLSISKIGGEDSVGTILYLSGDNDNIFFDMPAGSHEIQLQLPYLGLEPGAYTMKIKLKKDSIYSFDVVESFRFTVTADGKMSKCRFYQPRSWQLVSSPLQS